MSTETTKCSACKKPCNMLLWLALAFIIPVLAIVMLVKSLSGTSSDPAELTPEAIASRIQPVAKYNIGAPAPVVASATSAEPLTGEQVYNKLCMACHDAGLAGAPKNGDAAAWAPRIALGEEDMFHKAINGFNGMPARGGGATLTDLEVKRAVVFMVNASGGNFKEPEDK